MKASKIYCQNILGCESKQDILSKYFRLGKQATGFVGANTCASPTPTWLRVVWKSKATGGYKYFALALLFVFVFLWFFVFMFVFVHICIVFVFVFLYSYWKCISSTLCRPVPSINDNGSTRSVVHTPDKVTLLKKRFENNFLWLKMSSGKIYFEPQPFPCS